jgi:micrococcal nuclease
MNGPHQERALGIAVCLLAVALSRCVEVPTAATSPEAIADSTPGLTPVGSTETAAVVRVVDGDTIIVDRGRGAGPERLRYIGIDAPESVDPDRPIEWMGPEAAAANARLVEGHEVVLERDVSDVDRFGRLLRYVWVADRDDGSGLAMVNLELVAQGFAGVVTFPPDVRYADLFRAAQTEARDADRGLWGRSPPP